jgi:hypothetical protein
MRIPDVRQKSPRTDTMVLNVSTKFETSVSGQEAHDLMHAFHVGLERLESRRISLKIVERVFRSFRAVELQNSHATVPAS